MILTFRGSTLQPYENPSVRRNLDKQGSSKLHSLSGAIQSELFELSESPLQIEAGVRFMGKILGRAIRNPEYVEST